MSVRKRSWKTRQGETKEAWIVDYRDRDGDRHIETFDKKKDADAWHAKVSVDVRAGTHVAPSKSITVDEAAEKWLASCDQEGLERATVEQYRGHVAKYIGPELGRVKLCDLSVDHVKDFARRIRSSGLSTTTVRKITSSLSSLITEAYGRAGRNVAREVSADRRKRKSSEDRREHKVEVGVDIPLPEEISAILTHATGRWRPFLVTAAFTGLRASEMRGLTWANVDLKANKLKVAQRADKFCKIDVPKSKAGKREVPFGPVVANTLKAWKLACPKGEHDLVFPTARGEGNGIEGLPNILVRGWHPAQVASGVINVEGKAKYYGLHTLRHFYASWCISRGLSPKVIQTRLGHSSITMTFDTYGHLFPQETDGEEIAAAEDNVMKLVGSVVA
jgi:integrase